MKRVLSSSAESTDGKGFRPQPQQNLLHLDVSRSDDLAPCFDLALDLLVELLRGAGDRIKAKCKQSFLHFRHSNRIDNLSIEQLNDALRCSCWNENSYPT